MDHEGLSLALMAGLGAYHGLNPGMGWLFAVGLGLQERSRGALLRSLGPIALGHELSIGIVVFLVAVLGVLGDPGPVRAGAAVTLVAFGVFRFARPRAHPRWGRGSHVNRRELAWWSFLMSSAHGAGLMIAPVVIGAGAAASHGHEEGLGSIGQLLLVMVVHVGSMLAVMAGVALVVYERLGVGVLRKAWLNTDHVWAGAFVLAGLVTLFS